MRQPSTRDRILDQLKAALADTLSPLPADPPCACDECRVARARDVSPDPRILQVQAADFRKMMDLALARYLRDDQFIALTHRLFQKVPVMLREIEAAAVIAHLERGDF